MEDTLGDTHSRLSTVFFRLNPCFNGRYSRRDLLAYLESKKEAVLILVLMEDTLGVYMFLNQEIFDIES